MNFIEAVKSGLLNYFDFTGRAVRSEYRYFFLFYFLFNLILGWVPVIGWAIVVLMLIPLHSLGARRLHDIGRSGWWQLMFYIAPIVAGGLFAIAVSYDITFLPVVLGIVLIGTFIWPIIWFCTAGNLKKNRFGENRFEELDNDPDARKHSFFVWPVKTVNSAYPENNNNPTIQRSLKNEDKLSKNDNPTNPENFNNDKETITDEEDSHLYLIATEEVEGDKRDAALWAKCIVKNNGEESKAKYNYIEKRVEALKKEKS